MKQLKAFALLCALALGWQSARAGEKVPLPFETYGSGYFVKNTFERDAAKSFVVIHNPREFEQVFGVAYVMGDKSRRLPSDGFQSGLVVAAIRRGDFSEYKVEGVAVQSGVVELRYSVASRAGDSATFSCPLIVWIPKGDYQAVQFVENGKRERQLPVAGRSKPALE